MSDEQRHTGRENMLDLAIDWAVRDITRAAGGEDVRARVLARLAAVPPPARSDWRWSAWPGALVPRPWPHLAYAGTVALALALAWLWWPQTEPDRQVATVASPAITAGSLRAGVAIGTPPPPAAQPTVGAARETRAVPQHAAPAISAAGGAAIALFESSAVAGLEPLAPPAPLTVASLDLTAIELTTITVDQLDITPLEVEPLPSEGQEK